MMVVCAITIKENTCNKCNKLIKGNTAVLTNSIPTDEGEPLMYCASCGLDMLKSGEAVWFRDYEINRYDELGYKIVQDDERLEGYKYKGKSLRYGFALFLPLFFSKVFK